MKKMKILQLLCFPTYGSGSGTYTRKLSEYLVKLGHEIAIVAPETRPLKGVKIFNVKLPFMVAFTGHPEYPNAKLYSQLSGSELNQIQSVFSETIIKAVEKFEPDVIHVHHASNLSWVANYIKAVYQIHYIITSHNTDIINAILDKRYIALTQDALGRADVVTAVSKNTREQLLKVFGRGKYSLARKTRVVSCGVDTKMFPSRGDVAIVDKKYNLSGKRMVLYSGKITSIKGVDIFIKAAHKIKNVAFVVMGDGEEIRTMKNYVSDHGINNVVFTGYIGSDQRNLMSAIYRRADVLAVPSTVSEGVPLSALEAMSSGTPVVASNIGGIPTVVKNMRNGILVKPKSVSALVEGINKLLGNAKLSARLAVKAREDAHEKYDWRVITRKMEKYYQVAYERSQRNRATKRPSFVSEEEYRESKDFAGKKKKL